MQALGKFALPCNKQLLLIVSTLFAVNTTALVSKALVSGTCQVHHTAIRK